MYESTVPVHSMQATLELMPNGSDRTFVSTTKAFAPEPGFLGRPMSPMMSSQFKSMLEMILKIDAEPATRGIAGVRPAAGKSGRAESDNTVH
ncbi:MAG: hypothetical protein AAF636_23935 [Pseudomonadota bacterium]